MMSLSIDGTGSHASSGSVFFIETGIIIYRVCIFGMEREAESALPERSQVMH